MAIKTGEFIEIDFVGRVKNTNQIFDVTRADIAKKEGIFDEKQKYKPLIVCVGKGQLLKGLDKAVQTKKIGDEFEVELQPEEAFGLRDQKLIQLTTLSKFKEFRPVPGLQVSVDGAMATVKSVTGGRVILDFNHPLAGKVLKYWVKINRQVEKIDEKIKGLLSITLGLDAEVMETEKTVTIKLNQKLDPKILDALKKSFEEFIPEIKQKEVKFE
ncbi:MAG: peptidylprolyl isomerase [Candidatus Nanoarchaeia archaeon]